MMIRKKIGEMSHTLELRGARRQRRKPVNKNWLCSEYVRANGHEPMGSMHPWAHVPMDHGPMAKGRGPWALGLTPRSKGHEPWAMGLWAWAMGQDFSRTGLMADLFASQ